MGVAQSGSINMACCFASAELEREATRRSIEIDQYLEREKIRLPKQTKILLLGPSESGKSSFWRQMRIIYGEAYSEEERRQLTSAVYCTVLDGTRETIWCMKGFQIPFQYPENEQKCSVLKDWRHKQYVTRDVEFSPYVEPLMSLWKDEGVQEAVKRADLVSSHGVLLHLKQNCMTCDVSRNFEF